MPAITLRLTDEQHDRVREWAFVNKRSIQRELEARLFADGVLVERGVADTGGGSAGEQQTLGRRDTGGGRASLAPRSLDVPRSASTPKTQADAHCSRAYAHHNYHSGKPCPHCGYPE